LSNQPHAAVLEQPSQQASARWDADNALEEDYAKSYGRWRDRLSAEARAQIQDILDSAGVTFYGIDRLRPDLDAFSAWIGAMKLPPPDAGQPRSHFAAAP
jgi:hypothetical protein